ncbi:MAG: hypothetical protein K9N21_17810 [Deltaproteobacteria bacterium]|nr:hypothetical protein [Deltaproteobacteria bacterium]
MYTKDKTFLRVRNSIAENVHRLLEDYEVLSTNLYTALIPRFFNVRTLSENVEAAVIASSYGLESIDYAKKRYCDSEPVDTSSEEKSARIQYIKAYMSAKRFILSMISKFVDSDEELPLPSNGVFGASVVLERLLYSFFSSHLLYSLGHRYEGHAVSRLILEQIAWAHTACCLDNIEDISKISTTKTISALKKTQPVAGQLYGFLSKKTHIDYKSHFDFLRVENGRNVINHTQNEFYEYAEIILYLADLYGIVWEISQHDYLTELESIEIGSSGYSIKEDRPFLKIINDHLNKIERAANNSLEKAENR